MDNEITTQDLRNWVDKVRFEGPKGFTCLACLKETSCRYYVGSHMYACSYCGLSISAEFIYSMCGEFGLPVHHFIGRIRRDWERRKKFVEEAGVEFLLETLNNKGIKINSAPYESNLWPESALGIFQINSSNSKPAVQPKAWSYKEAAASEFNLDDDNDSGLV